jgi:hypothetical protein
MKKLLTLAAIVLCASYALAGVDSVAYSLTQTRHLTNSVTYVLRGHIESIYVDIAANTTNTILVTDSYGTILTKSGITADARYNPREQAQTTAGAASTWTELGNDASGATTNAVTTGKFGERIAVAGPVTVALFSPAAITTNDATVTILYTK